MALSNYQFQFGSFTFGAGTPWQVLSIDGLEALPDLRTQDDNQGYNDGMFSGRDFLGGRTITIELLTLAGNGNSAFTNFNLAQASLIPQQSGTTPFRFLLSPNDSQNILNARVRSRKTVVDPDYTYGFIKSQYELFAPDPRYYSDPSSSAVITPVVSTGRTYNRTYNLLYGSGTGSATINNTGSVTSYPSIVINGPFTTAYIGNSTTNQYLYFNNNIASFESINIDLLNRVITKTTNGVTVSARNLVSTSSTWWGLAPGNNTITLSASGTTGSTQATITYSPAYI